MKLGDASATSNRMSDLAELYARGREAWPDVELSREAFDLRASQLSDPALDFAGDLYLAVACTEGSKAAIDRFQSTVGFVRSRAHNSRLPESLAVATLRKIRSPMMIGVDPL